MQSTVHVVSDFGFVLYGTQMAAGYDKIAARVVEVSGRQSTAVLTHSCMLHLPHEVITLCKTTLAGLHSYNNSRGSMSDTGAWRMSTLPALAHQSRALRKHLHHCFLERLGIISHAGCLPVQALIIMQALVKPTLPAQTGPCHVVRLLKHIAL